MSFFAPSGPFLAPGEREVLAKHRHIVMLLVRLLPPLVLLLAILVIVAIYWVATTPNPFTLRAIVAVIAGGNLLIALLASLLLVLPLGWMGVEVYDWLNDWFVVTNRQVIRLQRQFIFSEERHSALLSDIQNSNVLIPDLLARIFNYGTVAIETAGSEGRIELDAIPDPYAVQAMLDRLRGRPPAVRTGRPSRRPIRSWREFRERLLPWMPVTSDTGDITWHKHWIVLFLSVISPLLMIFVIQVVWYLVIGYMAQFGLSGRAIVFASIFFLLILLTDAVVLLYQYLNWRNDIYILTKDRIIDIDQLPFGLHTDRREAYLQQIQDVLFVQPNPLYRILNVGNVLIETAGRKESYFTFDAVPSPMEVQRLIMDRKQQVQSRQVDEIVERIVQRQQGETPPSPGDVPPFRSGL